MSHRGIMKKFPQVLLLGNGINRCNGSEDWKKFLKSISDKKYIKWLDKAKSPMYMQAILLTGNSVEEKLKGKKEVLMPNNPVNDKEHLISTLLSLNFDEIITTNYTYELEQIALNNTILNNNKLSKILMKHTDSVKQAEPKYLLHTYNSVNYKGHKQRIWHIHGEARKPNSIIIDQYLYSNLLHKIKDHSDKTKNDYQWKQK